MLRLLFLVRVRILFGVGHLVERTLTLRVADAFASVLRLRDDVEGFLGARCGSL